MYQPFDLSGKVALVTGGNGGIGLGFCQAMAQAGADICIWGTNADKNAAAADALAPTGRKVHTQLVDVADSKVVDDAFAETLATMGRCDGVFANAGVTGRKRSFFEIDDEEWRRLMSVNLDGVFYTLRAATKHMVERAENGDPGGRIVATASLAALSGAARNEHYGATKGAVVSMIRAMAVEFARYGITANAILPGWIETDMTEGLFAWDRFAEAALPRTPVGRWGKPEDFGGIAVYLMSDASAFHTGDSHLIDGGYWIF